MSSPAPPPAADAATANALLRAAPPAVPPHLQSTSVLEQLVKPTLLPAKDRRRRITNWGGTFTDAPSAVFQPTTVAECCNLVELARRRGKTLRAVGRAHSPSDLMMTDGWAVRMEGLGGVLAIEDGSGGDGPAVASPAATFLAGTLVSDINAALAAHAPPCALSSLGSISEQTIGGLISTATHGSGYDFPAVSALCLELELIVALPPERGGVQLVRCSRDAHPDLFNATLCGLGSTGLITKVKLPVEPAFRLKHLVEEVEFDWLFGRETGFPAARTEQGAQSGAQEAEDAGAAAKDAATSSTSVVVPRDPTTPTTTPTPASIGQLVAADLPLPPLPPRYSPSVRQSSPADIFPCPATEDERLSRSLTPDDEDDEETRLAQIRIDQVVRSSQHTRLWWFPHVGMATLSRADRTYESAVKPTLGQRAYHSLVGFHLTQFLLFVSRYHSALPPRVARVVHYLTHPAFTTSHNGTPAAAATSSSAPAPPSSSSSSPPSTAPTFTTEFEAFGTTPAPTAPALRSEYDDDLRPRLRPLQPHHPSSMTVDHSHNVFNMDCLFPQYTTEWAIPASHTAACLRALRDWLTAESAASSSQRLPFHFPIEVRWTAPDGIWLSHGYARHTCYIGLIQFRPYNQPVPYRRLFAKFEKLMRHFSGRPHWAKTHTCGVQELGRMYPHLGDWLATRQEWDPQGVMLNPYVRRHLLGEVGEEVGVRRFKRRERGVL